ncbi:nucleolar protein 11 [Melitaea cinxia]|uniref:nucleolar protein 11 n=1 Tax=Melitaea cinxia TaxID=113334 RepID=UPI001E2726A8|nr:nucleolar protein 11 [Melitaea cinxia]
MAKLHNYYVLCPLIDQNSFLGVSQDSDVENVLVTLGRNVINKYRLSDQKQIGGWTSKEHVTSTVIFDKDQDSYVGVFNRNTIKMWKEDSDNLDKTKKYKFPINIFKLIPRENRPSLIIFNNGNCASLPYALDNRKTYESKQLIKESDSIIDVACFSVELTDYVCYVVKNAKDNYEILLCPIREELGDMEKSKLNKIKVSRPDDVYVVGELISVDDNYCVYFLWNDGKMTSYDLLKSSWKTIGTVPWISTMSSVSISWMGQDHLILFGSNTDQDGAIIVAYNVILGVGSCRYPMKMYSENAKLYCFNGRIILEASNHIGMLPYVLETKRNLSSLLGSHEIVEDTCMEIADWDTPVEPMFSIIDEVKDLLKVGLTERDMCAQVIPPLVEKGDYNQLLRVLKKFKDVPETVLSLLINYAIKLVNPGSVDLTNRDNFVKYCNCEVGTKKDKLILKSKFRLLDYLLQVTFSDAMLIPHLRNDLSLDSALFLMSYISHLLVDSDRIVNESYESKLFDWCILLMDAFYQQYLLTKDEKVSIVLNYTQKVIENLIDHLYQVDSALPLLHKILSGKQAEDIEESLSYAIELIEI